MAGMGLAQLITINDRNLSDVDIPNFLDNSPAMATLPAIVSSYNTKHRFLRYGLPTVNFRAVNDGRTLSVSSDTMVEVDLKILDATFTVDIEVAKEYAREAGGVAAYINREAARHLRAAMFKAEQQLFQGTALDAAGFAGFPNEPTLQYNDSAMVVNAGGAVVDSESSIYIVRTGAEDVELLIGQGGRIDMLETTIMETAGSVTGTYPAYYTPVSGYLGLKIGSTVSSVVRICNVTPALATDDLLYEGIAKFGTGRQPNYIFMTRAIREGLRKNRTTYNPLGTPASRPGELEGMTIIETDGISNTEAILGATP